MIARLSALLLSVTAYAALAAETATVAPKPAQVTTTTVKAQVIVESVNRETREIKLLGADNRRFTIVAAPDMRNFDQIRARDRVNVEYLQSVAIAVLPAGAVVPPLGASADVAVAPSGSRPGMEAVGVKQVEATVVDLDREARHATLLLEDGSTLSLHVNDGVRLDLVDVGDRVIVRTTQAVAIDVTPPAS